MLRMKSERKINDEFDGKKIKITCKSIKEYVSLDNVLEMDFNEQSFLKLTKTIKGLSKTVINEKNQYKQEFQVRGKIVNEMMRENFEMQSKLKEKVDFSLFKKNYPIYFSF